VGACSLAFVVDCAHGEQHRDALGRTLREKRHQHVRRSAL
jgi:hypothetical protein